MLRYAIVRNADNAKQLWQYLPSNYLIVAGIDGDYLVAGADNAGWTLDGYVIPRLASGLIQAVEVREIDARLILQAPADEREEKLRRCYDDAVDVLVNYYGGDAKAYGEAVAL